mgnify:FL=1
MYHWRPWRSGYHSSSSRGLAIIYARHLPFCVILHIYHNPFQVREPVPLIIHFLPVSVTFGLLGDGEFVVPSSFLMLTHTRVCNGHILTMYNIAGHGPNLPRRAVNERKTDC